MIVIVATLTVSLVARSVSSFGVRRTPATHSSRRSAVTIRMGLFDGVKDAFVAPALERSILDAERETPIDRWMGWSVRPNDAVESSTAASPTAAGAGNFMDSMDEENYMYTSLPKPMGILFEENDAAIVSGGIFVLSVTENSNAAIQAQSLKPGFQLVAVDDTKVAGLPFEDALGAIKDSNREKTLLIFFKGEAKQLYGPTGASQAWLDQFIAKINSSQN